jgi:DNA-binding MarR family transcriptional regulator
MRVRDTDLIRLTLEQRITYRFAIISKRLTDRLADMHKPKYGLNVNGWKVMTVIGRFGPLAAFEVGKFVSLDPDKVTRTVDALVKQGFVLRRQDKIDRRRIRLSLSVKGRKVHDEIEKVRCELEIKFLSVLNRSELAALYATLDKLEASVDAVFGLSGAANPAISAVSTGTD